MVQARPWESTTVFSALGGCSACSFSALGEAIHAPGQFNDLFSIDLCLSDVPNRRLRVLNGILHVPIDISSLEGLANARPSHPNAQDIIEIDVDEPSLTNDAPESSSAATFSSDLSASLPTGCKAKSRAKARLHRAFSRSDFQQTHQTSVKQVTTKKFNNAKTIHTDFEPIGQGYQGKRDEYDPVPYSLEMLKALGFDELEWDG